MKAAFLKILFLAIIFLNLTSVVWKNNDKYFIFDYWKRYPSLEYIYKNSQYVTKAPIGWVPDEFVNAYAGGAVIKGLSPILVIADQPPLGKYLIGLSALIFNNENIIILSSGIISLIFLFLIGRQIYFHKILAFLPVVALSFEPLFRNQFQFVPLLDIVQLMFFLPCLYFFNKGLAEKNKKQFFYFCLSSIFLGCFISTKFFITGLTVMIAFYLVLISQRKWKAIIPLITSNIFVLLVLMLSYLKVFLDGEGMKRFFGIQKWIFLYHKSQLILPLTIWPLILFNQWHVWWGDKPILSDPQWQITWPIVFLLSLLTIVLYFLGKMPKKAEFEVFAFWTICYLLFFSFGQITSRYLIIYLPILYLITLFGLENFLLRRKL